MVCQNVSVRYKGHRSTIKERGIKSVRINGVLRKLNISIDPSVELQRVKGVRKYVIHSTHNNNKNKNNNKKNSLQNLLQILCLDR